MEAIEFSTLENDINFLDFSNVTNEILISSQNQIIWAPNGTGKTSIIKTLKMKQLPITFSNLETDNDLFKKSKNKLTIGLGIKDKERLENENTDLLNSIGIKDQLKKYGITSQKSASEVLPEFPRCATDLEETFRAFNAEDASALNKQINKEDIKFYLDNRLDINNLNETKNEIQKLKNNFIVKALESLKHSLSETECICPVCNQTSNKPILEIINDKLSSMDNIKDNLAAKYYKVHPDYSMANLNKHLTNLTNITTTDTALLSYIIGQGDLKQFENIEEKKENFINNSNKIKKLIEDNESFFQNLLKRENEITEIFQSRFNAKVNFNRIEKYLEIIFPRNIDTYSTGELNLMVTLVRINEFLASDNSVMIFDDPLTSLDTANQYLIIFELLKLTDSTEYPNKSITVFTHNMNCISIAESQYPHQFKYYCMEQLSGKIIFNQISSDFFEIVNETCKQKQLVFPGSLCSESIILYCETKSLAKDLLPYINLILKREEENDSNAHNIFHWRGEHIYPINQLSNRYLIESINNFSSSLISEDSFEERTVQKIYYFIALRVWVEKQLYDNYPELFKTDNKQYQLGQMIHKVFDQGPWKGSKEISKEYLMSKKTMLNQSSHFKAQSAPFDFVINLSIDDVRKEIEDIKSHFAEDA